ncbi:MULTISPECIES: 3-dehydroquinate synthase [unclassified Nocardioides]|uniref:3-dehydroquinate synthase n=1 Tax=unclassified Nocardioides TaxID=2615069 RepID=UPI0009EFC187|nr:MULTISPECIES: 3-dehydroquinate synthase [unclassified Nocardioides]GAW49476.1 3-dehydroquinate synthase [Nocardioides sp. PD653-B2]GAW55010.1 3-dehydroquinate synthase [Nocardioides sp. PD653]
MRDTVMRVAGASPYDVVVGHDLAERLPQMLGVAVQRVAVVFSDELAELVRPVLDSLAAAYDVMVLPIPDGERAKKAAVAVSCWEALGEAGFTRSDAVVTFGGGATTDVGGFVAATWLRGVKVVHVPTTLLGMVDAAVGGKTGINTRRGKNLVGAFHEPAGVLCDLSTLRSLPRNELVSGLGEVVKCGFIADPAILSLVEANDPSQLNADSSVLRELVERAVRVKVDVVTADLKETGGADGHPGREVLNYGHTMAHAIERTENYRIRHGEAVAIGCVYVAELAARAGTLSADIVRRHHDTFARAGLPTSYAKASFDDLHRLMKVDKKSRGSQLRFVVLSDLAVPTVLAGPSEVDLRDAYAAIGGRG